MYVSGIMWQKYNKGLTDSRQQQLNIFLYTLFHITFSLYVPDGLIHQTSQPYNNVGRQWELINLTCLLYTSDAADE